MLRKAFLVLCLALTVGEVAYAQNKAAPVYIAPANQNKTVTKTSQTLLPANSKRTGWCIEAGGTAGASVNPIYFQLSTSANVVKAASATTGRFLAAGAGYCETGEGGNIYVGAITVIASSTSGNTVASAWDLL